MTADLVEFLRDRLDDDKEFLIDFFDPAAAGPRYHVGGWGKSRQLAEVEAKRQIVDEHANVNDGNCGTCVHGKWGYPTHGGAAPQLWPCTTLRLLALPFADHPDYRADWAPST